MAVRLGRSALAALTRKPANGRTNRCISATHNLRGHCQAQRFAVSDNKVIPFRRRPPSQVELEIYQRMTRHWSPTLRQLMFPEHFRRELERDRPLTAPLSD